VVELSEDEIRAKAIDLWDYNTLKISVLYYIFGVSMRSKLKPFDGSSVRTIICWNGKGQH
jgi:hypothetical protein